MGSTLELKRVEEPIWIKEMIKNLNKLLITEESKSKSRGVLIYNKLPQYLWSAWGDDLKRLNISWQDFLKILSRNSELIIDWAVNETVRWDELLNRLEGILLSYGKATVGKRGITLEKFLKGYQTLQQ
ncbi:MAG: hypothetical protein QXZ56_07370 [Sulfolobales archaeon]